MFTFPLSPGSGPGQALTLSHQGRRDEEERGNTTSDDDATEECIAYGASILVPEPVENLIP